MKPRIYWTRHAGWLFRPIREVRLRRKVAGLCVQLDKLNK